MSDSVLHCAAVCCSELQCVAVSCNAVQPKQRHSKPVPWIIHMCDTTHSKCNVQLSYTCRDKFVNQYKKYIYICMIAVNFVLHLYIFINVFSNYISFMYLFNHLVNILSMSNVNTCIQVHSHTYTNLCVQENNLIYTHTFMYTYWNIHVYTNMYIHT